MGPNHRGDIPEIDFAVAGPFRLLGDDDIQRVREVIQAHRAWAFTNARSTSLRGIPALTELFDDARLPAVLTRIVGVELALHPMRLERAHVNLQTRSDKPVDDWHIDYVPFVCVVMIDGDPSAGGMLRTRMHGDYALGPGEAILLQGAHVEHRAESVTSGERMTVVTSLIPADLSFTDTTRVIRDLLPYAPSEPLAVQAATYRKNRIAQRTRRIGRALDDAALTHEMEALMFEFERWREAAGEPSSPLFTRGERRQVGVWTVPTAPTAAAGPTTGPRSPKHRLLC